MKKETIRKRVLALMLLAAVFCSLVGCMPQEASRLTPITVTLLKVGKADAIVVLSGSQAMLIDTGEEDDGMEVVEFLQKHGITQVEAMVITHFDQDHVGGADTVLESFPVKTIYVPDYEGVHTEYLDFLQAAEAKAAPIQRLSQSVTFSFGDAEVLIEPPASYEIPEGKADYDNNFSLITTITHGKNRLVFMGDAEKARIREWLRGGSAVPCDFLKVPHHGIYNKALEDLFRTLMPKYSVICSSQKHPAEEKTLELLKKYSSHIFETKDGNILVISDGNRLEVQQKRK